MVRPGEVRRKNDTKVLTMILGRDICLTEMVGSINIGGGASVIETKQTTLGGVESI